MKTLAEELRDALSAAQAHLDYIGYGDAYEREGARDAKLEETINNALQRAERELP